MVRAVGNQLPVLFLWHHHQPFYQAPGQPYPVMPWVRLHAVKGYHDLLTAALETGARVTFNFTPALLEQLQFAAAADCCDEFERVSRIGAADLTDEERRFVLRHFFSINWTVHIRPHVRYNDLLVKRGETTSPAAMRQALMDYTIQDYADLIALFNLAWIGFAGRRDPAVQELIRRQRGYSSADIQAILSVHRRLLRGVLPSHKEAFQEKRIEISVSPYAHPILPLLCDTQVAAPDVPKPNLPRLDYRHPEDAARHLKLARSLHETVWASPAQGLWPSEGSVSAEALELAADAGFRWAATDQGILERSERSKPDRMGHFVSHSWKTGECALRLYFRDRALSDAIGFRYASLTPDSAVDEFTGHLQRIEEGTKGLNGRCVVIALDGENPWESYHDGGEKFLYSLFNRLESHPKLTTALFSDHRHTSVHERISQIHAGSWIDSNFHIWIGDPQKNDAWTELRRARNVLDDLTAGDPRRDECWTWLMRAQGSDWFWWYGEPFSSPYEDLFDELFRGYLRAVYTAAGKAAPPSLDVPIRVPLKPERRLQPAFPIDPVLDGLETSFYEWSGACRIDPRHYGAVMGRSEHVIRALYYGFNNDHLFFRFDPASMLRPLQQTVLTLHVLGAVQVSIPIPLYPPMDAQAADGVQWARNRVVEVAVSLDRIGITAGGDCQFWVDMIDDDTVLEKIPPAGVIRFLVPTREMVAANWKI